MSEIKPGVPFIAKDTETNRNCRIEHGARAYVSHVDGNRVSFVFSRRYYLDSEAYCDLELFGLNFKHDWTMSLNHAHVKGISANKAYPNDFFR